MWDLGTYELVEGTFGTWALDLYLSGRRLEGEWKLTREEGLWTLFSRGGRIKRDLPASVSALADVPVSDQSTRRVKRAS